MNQDPPLQRPSARGAAELGRSAVRQARALAADFALLAVLEARHAGLTLAWILSAGLVVAVLVVTAWLALVVAGMVWLFGAGMTWPGALAVAAGVNLAAAAAVGFWMRSLFQPIPFAATVRQLRGDAPPASQALP